MRISLRNYKGELSNIPVPYNTASALVMVITGDETIVFYDRDYKPITEYDSDFKKRRIMDRIDEMYYVNKEEFEKWDAIEGTSLERAEKFMGMVS